MRKSPKNKLKKNNLINKCFSFINAAKGNKTVVGMLLFSFAALLYLAAFPNFLYPQGLPQNAFIFAVPLFFLFDRFRNQTSKKIYYAFIWGLISYLLLIVWLLKINFFGYFLFTILLAIQPMLFFALLKTPTKFTDLIYVPALWVATELARSYMLGGFTWTLGHSQAFTGWGLNWTSWTGSYGISFGLILVNLLIYLLLKNKKLDLKLVIAILFLIFFGFAGNLGKKKIPAGTAISICAIQPAVSPEQKAAPSQIEESLLAHINLSYQCFSEKKPDMIVWPETAITDDVLHDKWINEKIFSFLNKINSFFLTGSAMLINGKDYNSAVFWEDASARPQIYHKQCLVPLVESCPQNILMKCDNDFKPGYSSGLFKFTKQKKDYNFGLVICSEDNYPDLFRTIKRNGGGFTVVLLNDNRLRSSAAMMMHLQNSVMQAAALRMPILRVSNSGITAYVNSLGEITRIPHDKPLSHLFNVQFVSGESFYQKYGDIFGWSCVLFVIIFFIKKRSIKDI